jgi:hypothetical protein
MPNSNQKEVIDTRILRLIGLEDVFDLDYETYLTLLKEAMVKGRMAKTSIPTEEVELLTNEYKRVKTKKDEGRFEVKGKKITAGSFSVGSIKAKLAGTKPKGLLPAAIGKSPIVSGLNESIAAITSAVTSIADTLKAQKKLTDDATAFDKRKSEQDKRALAESKLEKRFEGLKKTAEKIIAPVKSLLDRVLEFFTTILLGRVVYKLIEWLGNPENANKVKTIGRFLGDHWPKLLALYLTFGTSFGRFALGLTKAVAKGAVKLAFAIAKLLAAKKVKGAMGAARFLGGGKGKLLAGVLGTGAALGGAYAVTQGLKGGEEEPKTQKYSGGGLAIPRFSGGGLNFKGMLGGASMGAMFGPLGMLLGGALGSGKPQEMVGGFVSGEKGVDKVPAMLSDGEFVMSAGAVRKYGVDTLEGMNAAGGGTNKPKVVQGTTYAAGGGMIGDKPKTPELKKEAESGLVKNKPTFGPGATPQMSSQEDMNRAANQIRFEERIKRIENQIQVQSALASGKGLNIRGATSGAQLGTGYSAKYQGRDSIVIKGGAKNFSTGIGDREITLGGKRYYAQKKGEDVIYSLAKAGSSLVGGSGLKSIDKKKLPPTQIMMGGDGKPYIGFLAFEKGQPVYKRGATPGTGTTNPMEALGRFLNPNSYKENDKKLEERKKREAEVNSLEYYKSVGMKEGSIKQQMSATGQSYTRASNDLKFRKTTQAQIGKTTPNAKSIGPVPKPTPKPQVLPTGRTGRKRNVRGGGTTTSTPSFNATTKGMRSKQETLGLMR